MLTGKIFQEATGVDCGKCASSIEIWEAVKTSKPVKKFASARYQSNIVSNRGGIFDHAFHEDDLDTHLALL